MDKHELPSWYVYADRLTPVARPFYLAVGFGRDRFQYADRPAAWQKYVRKHKPANGVKTALEATRMTKRQAERQLARMVERWKPEVPPLTR